ncbi:DUF4344 domain-containing metallopeptidase [Vibrio agarivorans]|uniref:DUF4344 domain-containing metallopeptidase n=1 Tax=Vibrio agarivorans TaxID=153622 RepID=A0ABT7Y6P2_9VIBR|nr:DUF4344 domain-containing metallopeptidase [Vibrio agarivorans]MDN2483712.1 DUF4344 domain-containing metallopeptidase [Vibrio agarivorans]
MNTYVKFWLKPAFFCAAVLLSWAAQANIEIRYEAAETERDKASLVQIKRHQIPQQVVALVDDTLEIDADIVLLFGGEDGPLFDPQQTLIQIPYAFISEVVDRFKIPELEMTEEEVQQALDGALAHTLLHEIGHALVFANELPVLGKEEDAVDSFATLWLLEGFEDGQQMALDAALLFALEDQDIPEFEEQDFWAEHSLDIQRYYQTLCLVYGSDPERMQLETELYDQEFIEERSEICVEEFEILSANWQTLTQ